MTIMNRGQAQELLDMLNRQLEESRKRKVFYIDVSDMKFQSASVEEIMKSLHKQDDTFAKDSVKVDCVPTQKVVQIKYFSNIESINSFLKDNPAVEYVDLKVLNANGKYLIYKI